MYSSIGRCLLTRRNHMNIHVLSLNHCGRGKLLKSSSSWSFDSRHRHRCCHQACFSSSHDLIDHFSMAARRAGISFSCLQLLVWTCLADKALLIHLARQRREKATCQSNVSRCRYTQGKTGC